MLIILKLRKVGNAIGAIIPSSILRELNKVNRDNLEVEIKLSKENKSYRCIKCISNYFDSDEEIPYCPICGSEEVEELEDDN